MSSEAAQRRSSPGGDEDAIEAIADRAAARHGLDAAIQRYWTAIGYLKRRQYREANE